MFSITLVLMLANGLVLRISKFWNQDATRFFKCRNFHVAERSTLIQESQARRTVHDIIKHYVANNFKIIQQNLTLYLKITFHYLLHHVITSA